MILLKSLKISCLYNTLSIKWACVAITRAKSSLEPKTKTYSHTILFPKTNFPARSNHERNEAIEKTARFSELYEWQRKHLKGPEFVLHDGPPYANGDLHMGHAVNKIIKDINNRSQVLQGNRVHYVPGWDCHGLPIELKALQKANATQTSQMDAVTIRRIARDFALETVDRQKESFKSWGVMADWDQQCYLTLDKGYVKNQLRQFYEMQKAGWIYRALKPVYWSFSSKTALAEAELEYDPNFKSTELYVKFPIVEPPAVLKDLADKKTISAIIWTTTPWTLVANKAICYNPTLQYSVVSHDEQLYLIASATRDEMAKIIGELTTVLEFEGHLLSGARYHNGLTGHRSPLLPAAHVSPAKGTALVHTAPAHGPDDFLVALDHRLPMECNVDESGCYVNLDPELNGLPVLTAGQELVIRRLGDSVVRRGVYTHSYPLDWRTKQPVIMRASHQWFIDTAALKDKALQALDGVTILPPATADQSREGFRAQLEKRPYWCISRQRAWGVPIPALYKGSDVIVDQGVIDRLCALIDARGTDVWWTCDVSELLPGDVSSDVIKGKDIMDIWLDSGLSWTTLPSEARLYSEGVDQLTGWFQASLLTALALKGQAPYQSIFVHGFVVDEKRRKMSKSIGNVIDPATIIRGGEGRPAYGVDTLRWWVASHATQHSQIIISKKLLDDCLNEVVRIRNILKYLLGVTSDMSPTAFDKKPALNYFDKYMLSESHGFLTQINDHYNNFRYNSAAQLILFFISNKVSGLYSHCVKDRVYCSPKDSEQRLAAQLVFHTILVVLCKALGPILPHLVEETWQHHPMNENPFYFTQNIPVLTETEVDAEIMEIILSIKKDIQLLAKNENLKKLTAKITLSPDLYEKIEFTNLQNGVDDSDLCEILELSNVSLDEKNGGKWEIELVASAMNQCLRCRKYNALENSDKCLRCEKVMQDL